MLKIDYDSSIELGSINCDGGEMIQCPIISLLAINKNIARLIKVISLTLDRNLKINHVPENSWFFN